MANDVPSIRDITALEAEYVDRDQPALMQPRTALVERWKLGHRDRETALRLAFLDWYSCSEPDFLTGMPELARGASYFDECSERLLARYRDDEVGFVLGWMMKSFPYCCGSAPDSDWEAQGQRLWSQHAAPDRRPKPSAFAGRGAFGHYFEHISNVAH